MGEIHREFLRTFVARSATVIDRRYNGRDNWRNVVT
jgi:hypothetical protein